MAVHWVEVDVQPFSGLIQVKPVIDRMRYQNEIVVRWKTALLLPEDDRNARDPRKETTLSGHDMRSSGGCQ